MTFGLDSVDYVPTAHFEFYKTFTKVPKLRRSTEELITHPSHRGTLAIPRVDHRENLRSFHHQAEPRRFPLFVSYNIDMDWG